MAIPMDNVVELISKINPFSFARYLECTGWRNIPRKRRDIRVYQYVTDDDFEQVTIPLDYDLSDYNEAMISAAETVAKTEGKSPKEFLLHLFDSTVYIAEARIDNSVKRDKQRKMRIVGKITKLESTPDIEKRSGGRITIVYIDDNEKAKASTCELIGDDYLQAIDAHKNGMYVEIIGDVLGNEIEPESFVIIE